jgi:hypothetical protein
MSIVLLCIVQCWLFAGMAMDYMSRGTVPRNDYNMKSWGIAPARKYSDIPAPVVPSFRSEVSKPRDWWIVKSCPATLISSVAACESTNPKD